MTTMIINRSKKSGRTVFLLLIFFFFQFPFLKAVEFSVKEKAIIYTNAIKLMENYEAMINQIGISVVTDIEKAKSNAESFLELFVNRQVLIFNDLDPAHALSEFYEAGTYSSNIILWYPDGLSVKLDLSGAKVSDIMSHGDNVYSIDILAKKTISGNYMNQTMNRNVEELLFRIAFGMENKSLTRFRIVGVRSVSSNYVIDYTQALKEVHSEDFSPEDMVKVQAELKAKLNDYSNLLSLLGDPKEQAEDKEFYKEGFLNLFQNADTKIYNDINPDPATSLITVNEYLAAFVADYPNGIRNLSVNIDSTKYGKIMKAEDGSYYTYVEAEKFFSGSFRGKEVFRKNFPLIFKISFNASGKTYTGFMINSIDISSVNFYQATPGSAAEAKPETIIRPVTRKGLGMSLIATFGQTQINAANITDLTTDRNLHSWNTSPLFGYSSALGLNYFFNDHMAFRSGAEFNTFSSKFNLSGKFTNDVLSTDINSSAYYQIVEAEYDSLITINYLTLPFLMNYTTGKPGKFGFYGEGGLKVSIPVKSSYELSGNYKTSGYYPTHPEVIQYLDMEELGFYDRQNINETGKLTYKTLSFAVYGSVGINIPLGYYSSINFGPEIIIGLSDIHKEKREYVDIFGKTYTHQPTKVMNYGLRLGLAYKL